MLIMYKNERKKFSVSVEFCCCLLIKAEMLKYLRTADLRPEYCTVIEIAGRQRTGRLPGTGTRYRAFEPLHPYSTPMAQGRMIMK